MINHYCIDGVDFVNDANAWQLIDDEYNVFSPLCEQWFSGATLYLARHRRSEAERVKRKHDARQPTT